MDGHTLFLMVKLTFMSMRTKLGAEYLVLRCTQWLFVRFRTALLNAIRPVDPQRAHKHTRVRSISRYNVMIARVQIRAS